MSVRRVRQADSRPTLNVVDQYNPGLPANLADGKLGLHWSHLSDLLRYPAGKVWERT